MSFQNQQLASYPSIYIKRDGLVGFTHAPSKLHLDGQILIAPQNEPLLKRLARVCFEEGPIAALQEAEEKTHGHKINYLLRGLCFISTKAKQFNQLIWPYIDNQNLDILNQYSQTRYNSSADSEQNLCNPNHNVFCSLLIEIGKTVRFDACVGIRIHSNWLLHALMIT